MAKIQKLFIQEGREILRFRGSLQVAVGSASRHCLVFCGLYDSFFYLHVYSL